MITFFPDPYPDELLYSVCARYQERMMWGNQKTTLQDLFGTDTVVAVVDLPGHVGALVSRLPSNHQYSSDRIIDHHTLLPYFARFLAPNQLEGIRRAMRLGSGSGIAGQAGIMASTVKTPQVLQYCPQCVESDRMAYGETYWHRVHQLPGVMVCPHHPSTPIYPGRLAIHNARHRQSFDTLEGVVRAENVSRIPNPVTHPDLAVFIARQSWVLLTQSRAAVGLDVLRQRYLERLQERDLAQESGRIRARDFVQQFEHSYGQNWLRAMGCGLTEDGEQAWVLRMVRRPKGSQHPLKHLLLAYFLGMTIETLWEPKRSSRSSKVNQLWPCLNRTANHYGQSLISETQAEIRKTPRGKVGIFTCSCDFSYRCAVGGDPYLEAKVVQFGHLWESRLKVLSEDPKITLRGAARILGVDPGTVKYHATRWKLKRWQNPPAPEKSHPPEPVESQRQKWLDLKVQYPDRGRTALRQIMPAVWTWLYRHDREWLMAHQPSTRPTLRPKRRSRVDWIQRDRDCAAQVPGIVARLKQQQDPITRITARAIFRDLGRSSWLERHRDKLPLTIQAMSGVVEDRAAFALRRLDMAAADFWRTGHQPKPWELLRVAGIRTDLALLPEIQDTAARLCDPEAQTIHASS